MCRMMNLHRLAEERSLAIHRVIAAQLSAKQVSDAVERVRSWAQEGLLAPHYAALWIDLLAKPIEEIAVRITDPGEEARALRQTTPFVGIIDPQTRWKIWKDVRQKSGR